LPIIAEFLSSSTKHTCDLFGISSKQCWNWSCHTCQIKSLQLVLCR